MRKINRIVIHCTDTNADETINVDKIRSWHLARGFSDIGYHYVITPNGDIQIGRPIEKVGAHAKGFNQDTVGICLVGGRVNDEPDLSGNWVTKAQCQSMYLLTRYLCACFPITSIVGHNELNSKKSCPNCSITNFQNFVFNAILLERNQQIAGNDPAQPVFDGNLPNGEGSL